MLDPVSWQLNNGDIIRVRPQSPANLDGSLRLIDQTLLPEKLEYLVTNDLEIIYDAIKQLKVRGAPAIGCAAGLGLAAHCRTLPEDNSEQFIDAVKKAAEFLAGSRPTAVNLFWALNRCVKVLENASSSDVAALKDILTLEGLAILEQDIKLCRLIGQHGATLLKPGMGILTHCNAGALATGDYGTALSPVYCAAEQGVPVTVYSDETRPLLQGSRLTAWELNHSGVDVVTICDNMAAQVMKEGKIDIVIVGTDRVAANGDVANKIGTYGVAILAAWHKIPFYVATPYSTIDLELEHGGLIPIEQRDPQEIRCGFGKVTAPENVRFYNPAFDVTPHELVTGFITDRGIITPPFKEKIAELVNCGGN
jgi:methylthioribose-1-phosphate isomerase